MKYKRSLARTLALAKHSILLLGPRQTGKSTLIRSLAPDLEINFANEREFVEFASNPSRLEEILAAGKAKTIFIDEIQRLPNLLNTIQSLIDSKKRSLKFYLTGSSARKLRRGQANLLPGRVLTYYLAPLTLEEIAKEISLKDLMAYGTMPGILSESDVGTRRAILRSYANTYLREEIQAEALTKNIEGFSRFLFTVAAYNGQFINFSRLASESGVQQKTATRFFEILEDTLIIRRLNSYSKSDLRRMVQHPKFYFFDNGVLNGLLENFNVSADRVGSLFETLVFNQIAALLSEGGEEGRFSTYRTNKGVEVDFIFEREGKTWAIEVKASTNIGPTDLNGIKSFLDINPKAKPMIIYLGTRELEKNGIPVLPLKTALERLKG